MLATPGPVPQGPQWCYEFKWDGVRALVSIRDPANGGIRIHSRSGGDITRAYPEVVAFARHLFERVEHHELRLDGEIIALGPDGRPSFGTLQSRMAVNDDARARQLADSTPVSFLAFDILAEGGQNTMDLAYEQRRALLEDAPDRPAALALRFRHHRRRRISDRARARARGRRRQAEKPALRAGPALRQLDQDTVSPASGRGHRRLGAGPARQGRAARRAAGRRP